ncbi:MAG TPA: transcription antitermination factor NusB [Candidatus Eisenbacteria bacterium]|jgi:N utilization substance protein B
MTTSIRERHEAREIAFRATYQSDVTGEPTERCLEEILEEARMPPGASAFAHQLVRLLAAHRQEVDASIARVSRNWPIARMAATDRSVLRVATVELYHVMDTPVRVALDEAIEIAKKYGMESSGAFVNGILDRLAHEARPGGR